MINVVNTKSLYSSLYCAIDYCKKHKGEEIEIIVPDKLSLFMEKFLFEHLNISASFDIRISTLNRFAKRKVVIDKEKQISKAGSVILINKILNENIEAFNVFKSKAYSFNYAENIYKTITQLKASKITFEELENFSGKDKQLKDKILDLALVYKEYEKQKAGYLDSSDLFLMSTFYIAEGLENRNIIFVGFDDFTAIEYSIIERLSINNNVNVVVNFSSNSNKHLFNNEIFTQLKNIAYINEINFKTENFDESFSNLRTFLHSNLFSYRNEKYVLDKEIIKVFSGNNVSEELEFVARDIRYKILNNEKYSNFGVAVFGLENNINKIKEIFSKYEINYYIDNEICINNSVFYKFLCSLFKYNLESYNLCHLIDLINSPFFEMEDMKKQKLLDRLISLNFKGRVNGGLSLGDDYIEEQNQLISFFKNLNIEYSNAESFVVNLKEVLKQLDVENVISGLENFINLQEVMLLKKSMETIFLIFDEIVKFNRDISLNEFIDTFVHISSVVKIKNLPLTLDAVKIVDANNTCEIFDDLYIVNCTSDNAPNFKFDCGIILDNEIEKLNFKHKLSPTIAHINKLAKLRLFNTALLFEKNLTVTYSQKRSDLISDLLNKIQVDTSAGVIDIVPIINFKHDKYLALSNNDYLEYICKNNKKLLKNNKNVIKNKEFIAISKENLNIFNDFKEISATTLENYFKCPFYCFMQNILSVKPRLKTEILSFDVGNVLHEIMFKYYKLNKNIDDVYLFCKKEVFNFVEKDERLKINLNSPILTALIDEAVRVISAIDYIDKNSKFVPIKFEHEFKNETSLKLKNINIKGKVDRIDECDDFIRIIDYKSGKSDANLKELYYGNKLQLFLYACAMEKQLNKKVVASFYLPLRNNYTKELENIYSLKGFFINEDFVIKALDKRLDIGGTSDIINLTVNSNFKAGRTKGVKKLEDTEMSLLKDYSKNVSQQAVEEIKNGYIKPTPSEISKPCEYCPYSNVCMKDCANIKFRMSKKIDIGSFKEVHDE